MAGGRFRAHGYWHFFGLQATVPDVETEPFRVSVTV
jgi:hypothetical protein